MSYLQFISEKSSLSFYVPKLFSPASSPTLLPTENKVKIKRSQPLYNLTVRFPTQEVFANLHRIMPALPGNVCQGDRLSREERNQLLPLDTRLILNRWKCYFQKVWKWFLYCVCNPHITPKFMCKIFWKSWTKWQNRKEHDCQQKNKVLGTVIPGPQVPMVHPQPLCSRLGGTNLK